MKYILNLLMLVVTAITGRPLKPIGISRGRRFTTDVAITYRMDGIYPGQINRFEDATLEPCLIDASAPPTAFGQPVVVDPTTQGVRPLVAGDTAVTDIYGFTARPYPYQPDSASNYGAVSLGNATPPATGVTDILRSGYIGSKLGGSVDAVKGGRVYIWIAVSSGAHVQGAVEAAATSGSTILLPARITFNGPKDANGNVELSVFP